MGEAELCSGPLIQDLEQRWHRGGWELAEHPPAAGGQQVPPGHPSHPGEPTAESPPHPAIPKAQRLSQKTTPQHHPQQGKLGQDYQLLEEGTPRSENWLCPQAPEPGSACSPPPAPQLPSAELGLLSSVCSFSSFSRFSEAHAPDSSCCRMVGQNSLNSLCPTGEPSLRLWMAKSSTELKHWGREGTEMSLEIPTAPQGDFRNLYGSFRGPQGGLGVPSLHGRGSGAAEVFGRHWRVPLPHPGGSAGP